MKIDRHILMMRAKLFENIGGEGCNATLAWPEPADQRNAEARRGLRAAQE